MTSRRKFKWRGTHSFFPILTVESCLRVAERGNYMVSCNVGEIFPNYMIEPSIRPYFGLYLSYLSPDEALIVNGNLRGYWERVMMRYSISLYLITKDMMVVESKVRGDRLKFSNAFRWGISEIEPTRDGWMRL